MNVESHIKAHLSHKEAEAQRPHQYVQGGEETGLGASHLKPRPHLSTPHSCLGKQMQDVPSLGTPALSSLVPFSPRAAWEAGQSLLVHSQGLHELSKNPILFFDLHAIKHTA